MNFQNDKYTLRFATSDDNEGIRKVFESGSFQGDLDIRFLRNPAPYDSFLADGEDAKILVITDNKMKKIIAVGGAVIRYEYIGGKKEKCAYLTGLKICPDYQGKISFIKKAYALLGEAIADCYCSYTTILDSNKAVIAMFSKQHKNMPEYRYLGHYTTYCFHGGKPILALQKDNRTDFEEIINEHLRFFDLTPAVSYKGLGKQHFFSYREKGNIKAFCLVGNQQAYKQYEMNAYGGIYKWLSKLPTDIFGYPKFPKQCSIINHGIVAYLYVQDNDERLCRKFLRSVAYESEFDLLLWGGFEEHPLCKALNKMKTVHYGSRLYEVIWQDKPKLSKNIGMEVGLL